MPSSDFENTATNYQRGSDWEWAAGIECVQGLVLGLVGYDYCRLEEIVGDLVRSWRNVG